MPTRVSRLVCAAALICACAAPADDPVVADVSQAVLDCNGGPTYSCYADEDGDGIGAGLAVPRCSCTGLYVTLNSDCNDNNANRWRTLSCYTDADGDHYGAGAPSDVCAGLTCADGTVHKAESAGDCNDSDADIHPFRGEIAANEVDDNCDGAGRGPRALYYSKAIATRRTRSTSSRSLPETYRRAEGGSWRRRSTTASSRRLFAFETTIYKTR